MKSLAQFWSSTWGHLVLAGLVLVLGTVVAFRQKRARAPDALPAPAKAAPLSLPKVFLRGGQRLEIPAPASKPAAQAESISPAAPPNPSEHKAGQPLPLVLAATPTAKVAVPLSAPYGRLIPCITVVTLESNHLDTPVIGLVTDDVWHDGKLVVPAGAEVHGRASVDRNRERLAATGSWVIVWRTKDPDNGTEVRVNGIALDREVGEGLNHWGEHDGSAGLRGEVLRSGDDHELRLFAATFLATATSALQDLRTSTGLIGEASIPATTTRNATLAGTGAILREYAQQLRDAVAKDGFYVRVPAGKSFYLYVTQPIERRAGAVAANSNPP
jgi:hypothetical protein